MSTESEELDEDELLEVALRDQAHRDLDYKKGRSSTKAVANFIQPPPPPPHHHHKQPPPALKINPNSTQKQLPLMDNDDDDDSEVEMLSISSGDEDSPTHRRTSVKGGVAGGPMKEKSWDGSEANSWKRVDEAELVRRVREMRESRVVPMTQMIEPKPSALGRQLNSLQSFPRGMECVDPLGLGIIDNKSLRLITDASGSSPSKFESNESVDILREKLLYFSEKFNARTFLSRIHRDTTAADLEGGSLALKTDLKGRTQQKKQLVKENFDCFVSCKTTIDDIESKLRRIEEDPEGSGTSHLFSCIEEVTSIANRAFQPLFERQTQAEKIRSVQGMLQRFRTLFNLPSMIRQCIRKGEFDLAVREYRKAKSIVLPSHVGILKRVLEEVENVMHDFKGTLYKSMEDPQADLTCIENTVRLLLELEPESDPIWHYLNIQNNRIGAMLERCTLENEGTMKALYSEARGVDISDVKCGKVGLVNSTDLDDFRVFSNSKPTKLIGEELESIQVKYICRLTAVIVDHIPDFWKLSLSIFGGKHTKVSSETSAHIPVKNDEKNGDGKYTNHTLDEVTELICGTISVYELKVKNAFSDLGESNILHPYVSEVTTELCKLCKALEAKESVPLVAAAALQSLSLEIMKIYVQRLCSWMRSEIQEIPKHESWILVSVLERNKSPYTISYSPLALQSVVSSAMDQIYLTVKHASNGSTMSEIMSSNLQEITESIRLAFLNSFLDFAGHLERLAADIVATRPLDERSQLDFNYDSEENKPLDFLIGSVVDPHQRLLIVLSNIGYCKDELSFKLYKKYKYIWLQQGVKYEEDSDINDLVLSFSGLEDKILAHYTLAKSNLVRAAAMNYLFDGQVSWTGAPAVKGVRDAAVELLHTLVNVHAEVFSGAKPLLDRILGIIVEALIDTFLSLFHENKDKTLTSLDPNGFCQIMLELEYFETILHEYMSGDGRESLKDLQGVLLEKATESAIEAVDETPTRRSRGASRGNEAHPLFDDNPANTLSPDDLIALAQRCSSELLQAELERTRVNTSCFADVIELDSVPESARLGYVASLRS